MTLFREFGRIGKLKDGGTLIENFRPTLLVGFSIGDGVLARICAIVGSAFSPTMVSSWIVT